MSSTNAFQALFFEFFIFQELFPENVNGRIRSWVVQRRAECWPALFLQIISETSTPIANMVRDVFVEKNVRKKKTCMGGPPKILRISGDIKVFLKKKIRNSQKKNSLEWKISKSNIS